jgi:hypothetical protein
MLSSVEVVWKICAISYRNAGRLQILFLQRTYSDIYQETAHKFFRRNIIFQKFGAYFIGSKRKILRSVGSLNKIYIISEFHFGCRSIDGSRRICL